MKIKHITVPAVILILGLTVLGVFTSFKAYAQETDLPEVELFYSDSCGYCTLIMEKIEDENLAEKIDITYHNVNDSDYQTRRAEVNKICQLDTQGVPVMFAYNYCYVGSNEIEPALDYYSDPLKFQAEVEGENISSEDETVSESNSEENDQDMPPQDSELDQGEEVDIQIMESEDDKDESQESEDGNMPERPRLRTIDKVLLIVAPLAFLTIMYLLIKSLKL